MMKAKTLVYSSRSIVAVVTAKPSLREGSLRSNFPRDVVALLSVVSRQLHQDTRFFLL